MKQSVRKNRKSVVYGFSVMNLCLLLLSFSIVSCSDSILDADVLAKSQEMHELEDNVVYPRLQKKRHKAMAAYGTSINWESWETLPLASGQEVTVPWGEDYYGGAIPIDIARDIKAENGWELIAHTFKTNGLLVSTTNSNITIMKMIIEKIQTHVVSGFSVIACVIMAVFLLTACDSDDNDTASWLNAENMAKKHINGAQLKVEINGAAIAGIPNLDVKFSPVEGTSNKALMTLVGVSAMEELEMEVSLFVDGDSLRFHGLHSTDYGSYDVEGVYFQTKPETWKQWDGMARINVRYAPDESIAGKSFTVDFTDSPFSIAYPSGDDCIIGGKTYRADEVACRTAKILNAYYAPYVKAIRLDFGKDGLLRVYRQLVGEDDMSLSNTVRYWASKEDLAVELNPSQKQDFFDHWLSDENKGTPDLGSAYIGISVYKNDTYALEFQYEINGGFTLSATSFMTAAMIGELHDNTKGVLSEEDTEFLRSFCSQRFPVVDKHRNNLIVIKGTPN